MLKAYVPGDSGHEARQRNQSTFDQYPAKWEAPVFPYFPNIYRFMGIRRKYRCGIFPCFHSSGSYDLLACEYSRHSKYPDPLYPPLCRILSLERKVGADIPKESSMVPTL